MIDRFLLRSFALDTKSLRLGRIAIGSLLLLDLLFRVFDLGAFYTDAGVLPRAALELTAWDFTWSLHMLSGAPWFQAVLFFLTAAAAVAFVAGWRPQLAAAVIWILLTSLHARNPLLRDGQDDTFRVLFFWFMFMPRSEPRRLVLGLPGAAYVAQLCLIYWAGCFAKFQSPWWTEGTALHYVLSMSRYQTPLALWVLGAVPGGVLRMLTFFVLALELVGPFFLFAPWRVRRFVVFAFVLLHLSFAIFLKLGVFPFLSAASWLVLLPSEFWRTPAPEIDRDRHRVRDAVVAVALTLVVVLQIPPLRVRPIALAGVTLGLHQNWGVFAPNPVTPLVMSNGYFVVRGVRDGASIEVFRDVPNHRWRHYLANLRVTWPRGSELARTVDSSRAAWAEGLCREHRLSEIRILYLNLSLDDPPSASPRENVLYQSRCDSGGAAAPEAR